MTIHARHIAKYIVYSLGLVATIATSPLYEYFGTTAFEQLTTGLSTDVTHIPIQATVEFADPTEAEPFQYCGWNVVVELNEPITLDTEVVLWGLNSQWDQGTFDLAYATALESQPEEPDQDDTAVPEDTGNSDTGSDTGQIDTGGLDSALPSNASEPYEVLSPEHQVFYDTMRTFGGGEYAYRVTDFGTLNGPLFEDYASIVSRNSIRILYYSECGNTTSHFVLTVLGEQIEVDATVTMVAHQGEQIAQPIACGAKPENPDYTNVRMQVIVE